MEKEIKWKYEIGQIVKDDKRNITIIDKEIRICNKIKSIENKKYYKYKCNKCGYNEGWMIEGNLLIGNGCRCCGGKTVIKGINDIATTHPNIVKYFKYKDDSYKYSYGSHKKSFNGVS